MMKMKRRAFTLMVLPLLVVGLTPAGRCFAQALPDSLVERIRAGAAEIVLPGDSVALPLVGTPTLPLVEVRVNGTLRFGELTITSPLVYVNPDAEEAWLGAAAMAGALWTFDPRHRRLQVLVVPDR